MLSRRLLPFAIAVAMPLALTAGPAAADWLVLGDGGRVETRGPWQVRGRLLVFTTADGQLSSLRLSDVDLDASREATEVAARKRARPPVPPPARQPREAVFVLTDADVAHYRASPSAPPTSEPGMPDADGPAGVPPDTDRPADANPDAAGAAPPPELLVVTEWQESAMPNDGGLRLNGTLQNRGGRAATMVRLTAMTYNREGSLVASGEAQLSTDVLMPTRQARFQVDLPGVFDFSDVRFDLTSLDFEAGASPNGEPEEGEPEEGLADSGSGPA